MKRLNLAPNQIACWSAAAAGLLLAAYLGGALASGDLVLVAIVVTVLPVLVAFIKMRQAIWLLIPIGWFLTGRSGFVPVPLTGQEVLNLVAIAGFALLAVMRQVPIKTKKSTLDYIVYLNVAYVVGVFIRHPAGLFMLQTDQVGGRAYLSVLVAFGVFLVLSRATLTPAMARMWPVFALVPLAFASALETAARLQPNLAPMLSNIYSSAAIDGAQQQFVIGEQRLTSFQTLGTTAVLALVSYLPPLSLINPLYPGRMLMLLLSMGVIFLSGFRLAVAGAAMMFSLSLIARRQIAGLWIVGATGIASLVVLIFLQGSGTLHLPLTLQRSLSFLPGDWHPDARSDAEESTQWRIDMWKWAWEDSRILRDKIWGQGFGVTLEDMKIEAATRAAGRGEGSGFVGGAMQEWWLINGAFHNGPLSAIRNVGTVGLILYMTLIISSVRLAWSLCVRAVGTPLYSMTLFVALPVMWEAFRFTVLYGHYPAAICQSLYWAGLLNLLRNNLPVTAQGTLVRADNSLSVTSPVVQKAGESAHRLKQYSRWG